jgi:hypothetical protein
LDSRAWFSDSSGFVVSVFFCFCIGLFETLTNVKSSF